MKRYLLFAAYVGVVILTNVVFTIFGVVAIAPGVMGPSAVYVAGLAFVVRDYLHRAAGPYWCVAAIIVGAVLSALFNPALALASGLAFLFSELADLLVFVPLRKRGFIKAAVASNVVGIVLDSLIFLLLAFGSLAFLPGQIVGKAYATVAFVVFELLRRKLAKRSPVLPLEPVRKPLIHPALRLAQEAREEREAKRRA